MAYKFKVNDRVRINTANVLDGGKAGTIVRITKHERFPYEVLADGSTIATPLSAKQLVKI